MVFKKEELSILIPEQQITLSCGEVTISKFKVKHIPVLDGLKTYYGEILFSPKKIPIKVVDSVTSADGKTVYLKDSDYIVQLVNEKERILPLEEGRIDNLADVVIDYRDDELLMDKSSMEIINEIFAKQGSDYQLLGDINKVLALICPPLTPDIVDDLGLDELAYILFTIFEMNRDFLTRLGDRINPEAAKKRKEKEALEKAKTGESDSPA